MRTPRSRAARLAPDRTGTRRHRTLTKTAVAACVLVLAAAGCGREAGAGEDQGVSVAAASGDSPVTKVMGDKLTEALTASVQRATPEGWQAADFRPDTGVFRCGFTPYRYTVDHGKPTTLADVDKSMSDLE